MAHLHSCQSRKNTLPRYKSKRIDDIDVHFVIYITFFLKVQEEDLARRTIFERFVHWASYRVMSFPWNAYF